MNDRNLYMICKKYGTNALLWRNKFLGLLPEVWKRKLFEKKGYGSIFEFASKLAGISQEQVRLVLNLEHRFEDKPALHNLLIKGEVSLNKLARVVSIASVENQQELAEKVQMLSQSALNTLVKDEKFSENENGLDKTKTDTKSLFEQTKTAEKELTEAVQPTENINRDFELMTRLPEKVKTKLKEMNDKGIDIGKLLTELLEQHEKKIAEEKERLAADAKPTTSRYIPVKIKTILHSEHGQKCSIHYCSKPAKVLHHTSRFALSHSHDPRYLAPLCAEHHEIAHTVDERFWHKRKHSKV